MRGIVIYMNATLTLDNVLADPLECATIPFDDFMEIFARTPRPDGWRDGQTLFNIVHAVRPDVADAIRGSLCDPFYQDVKIADAVAAMRKIW